MNFPSSRVIPNNELIMQSKWNFLLVKKILERRKDWKEQIPRYH